MAVTTVTSHRATFSSSTLGMERFAPSFLRAQTRALTTRLVERRGLRVLHPCTRVNLVTAPALTVMVTAELASNLRLSDRHLLRSRSPGTLRVNTKDTDSPSLVMWSGQRPRERTDTAHCPGRLGSTWHISSYPPLNTLRSKSNAWPKFPGESIRARR